MDRKSPSIPVCYRLPANIERDITLAAAVCGTTKTDVLIRALEVVLPLLIGTAKPTRRAT